MSNTGGLSTPSSGTHELPLTYGYSFATLLARDPGCVFAQWEVPPWAVHQARERWIADQNWSNGAAADSPDGFAADLVLRFHDLGHVDLSQPVLSRLLATTGETGDLFMELNISERDGFYVHLHHPGRILAARIGLRLRISVSPPFIPIVTSNVVQMPPGQPWEAGRSLPGQSFAPHPGLVFGAHLGPGPGAYSFAPGLAGSSDFARNRKL